VDHLGGSIDRALAADENDAPLVPLLHAGKIRTAQAHAAKHVDLEEPPPFLVGNTPQRLWLETRMSTSGNRWSSVSVAAAVDRPPAKLSILESGTV
jgi:hypothetical protein